MSNFIYEHRSLEKYHANTSYISASIATVNKKGFEADMETCEKKRASQVLTKVGLLPIVPRTPRRYCSRGFRETLKPFAMHVEAGELPCAAYEPARTSTVHHEVSIVCPGLSTFKDAGPTKSHWSPQGSMANIRHCTYVLLSDMICPSSIPTFSRIFSISQAADSFVTEYVDFVARACTSNVIKDTGYQTSDESHIQEQPARAHNNQKGTREDRLKEAPRRIASAAPDSQKHTMSQWQANKNSTEN